MSAGSGSRDRLALAACVAATAAVHARALGASFATDDFLHLFGADALPLGTYLAKANGGHFMALHKLIFLGLHRAAGLAPLPFFALALATHLANTALLFRLCRALGAGSALAAAAAGLWGTAPVHQESLRWFSVYGAVLSHGCALLALIPLAKASREARPLRRAERAQALLALIAGAAASGGGAVVALCFPAVAALALPPAARPAREAAVFGLAAAALLGVGLCLPREALPSDPRLAAALFAALVGYGAGVLFAGPWITVHAGALALFPQHSAAVAIRVGAAIAAGLLAAFAVALRRSDPRERRLAVGLLLPGIALYAAVAWNRALLLGSHPLAEVASFNRYHYAPTALLLASLVCARRASASAREAPRVSRAAALAAAALAVALCTRVALRSEVYGARAARDYIEACEIAIRRLARAQAPGATLHLRNHLFHPTGANVAMGVPRAEFPDLGAYWLIAHGSGGFEGRAIRFVEFDAATLAQLRAQLRPEAAALFGSPEEAARAGAALLELREMPEIAARWERALQQR